MVLIINCFALQIFVIVYIFIIRVYGGYKEDEKECTNQIKDAFGNCPTASDCLQYAIKYYVYDENTAGFAGQSSGQSSGQEDPNINVQISDDQMFEGLGDQLNFEGLQDFIEADSYIADQGSSGQPSEENDPNYNVQSANVQHSRQNVDPENILNVAKQYHYRLPTVNDINRKDYATQYHISLYRTMEVFGLQKREDYCYDTDRRNINLQHNTIDCMNALAHFGSTQISAVRWAFARHTLAECLFLQMYLPEYKYITDYMLYLSSTSIRIRPSKRPQKFCKEFVRGLL